MPRHSREDDRRRSQPYDDSSRDRRSHHHKVYYFATPFNFYLYIARNRCIMFWMNRVTLHLTVVAMYICARGV